MSYRFNSEYEEWLLGSLFRNLKRISDIEEEYPNFVIKKNQDVWEYIRDGVQSKKILSEDDIIPRKKRIGITGELIAYLIELNSIVVSDANSIFFHKLEQAKEEKAKRDALRLHVLSQDILTKIQDSNIIRDEIAKNITVLQRINASLETKEKKETPKNDLKFPEEIMEGAAGDFAELYHAHLESCKEFFYLGFLTCLGSIFSNLITIENELFTQPRLYTLLIGQSATTRKSTTLQKTIEIFTSTIHEFKTSWGVNSAEGLAQLLTEKRDFESGKSLLLVFDEFKTFISKAKIENSVLLPMVTSLYESNRYEANTVKTKIKIEDAHLSILGASTIETFETMWTKNFLNIGFLNRIFLVPGISKKRFAMPPLIDLNLKQALVNSIRDIARYINVQKSFHDKFRIPISEEAKKLYHSWYMNLKIGIYTKRLDTIALRFMLLLAINVQKEYIDLDIVQKVIKLMDWQLRIREMYDPIDSENAMATMEQSIIRVLKRNPAGTKDRDLKKYTAAYRAGLWIYKTAITNLIDANEIQHMNRKYYYVSEKEISCT